MKYVIIQSNADATYMGKVYLWIQKNEVETLNEIKFADYTVEKSQTLYFGKQNNLKDVTPVYDKIVKLCQKMSNIGSGDWSNIDNIRANFRGGKYPTKRDFKYMNKIWNKYSKAV